MAFAPTCRPTARQDGRRYFRPETMALIDAVVESGAVGPALLIAS